MIDEEGKCRAEAEARGLPVKKKDQKERERERKGVEEQKREEWRPKAEEKKL